MEFTLRFIRIFFLELYYAAPVLVSLILLITIIGGVIGKREGWSRLDAFYHAFINATTVGYGDLRPTQNLSKMLAISNALVGLVFTGIIVAVGLHAADYAFNSVYDTSKLLE